MRENRKSCSFCSSQEQNPDIENGFVREEISENLSVNCHVLDAFFAGFMIRMLLSVSLICFLLEVIVGMLVFLVKDSHPHHCCLWHVFQIVSTSNKEAEACNGRKDIIH